MTKTLKLGLIGLFLLQILVASGFELAHDEAYYWLFSKNLDWGYFDHPPLVALTIRLFSFLPHSELAVRFGFILMQFGTLFLLFRLIPQKFWNLATVLFFAFPLASFTGLLALPDMPLLFMTAAYCVALKRYLEKEDTLSILLMSFCIPVLLYAKYHGILVIFFTLVALPKLFMKKSFYVITLLSILLFLPHVLWQYEHDFSTLRYHFLERPSSSFSFKRCLDYIGTQIGLAGAFVGPVVWWIIFKTKTQNSFDRVMKCISVGVVGFFLISTFSKKFEANWTIFLTVPMIVLVVSSELWKKKIISSLLYASFALIVLARLIFVMPENMVKAKRIKEFKGWAQWSEELKEKCGDKKLMANSYQIASKLSFYLNDEIQALNYRSRKNQFDYWRFDKNYPSENVCYITDKTEFGGLDVVSPEGKDFKLVTDQTISHLYEVKSQLP